jgi:hypothetical protein
MNTPGPDAGQVSDFHSGYCDGLTGHECSCDLPFAILAIEAEARAPLDVERVARIFHDRLDQSVLGHAGPVCQPCRQNAKDFAREYAKEPQP